MTIEELRDQFAIAALSIARETASEYELREMFGSLKTGITREEIRAANAYRIADAMIHARNKSHL